MKCLNFVFRLHVSHESVVRLKYIDKLAQTQLKIKRRYYSYSISKG